jgi:hypothetical protein
MAVCAAVCCGCIAPPISHVDAGDAAAGDAGIAVDRIPDSFGDEAQDVRAGGLDIIAVKLFAHAADVDLQIQFFDLPPLDPPASAR